MAFHDLANDRQTDPRSLVFLPGVKPLENLEYFFLVGGIHSDPVILHREPPHRAFLRGRHPDPRIALAELDGIADQVLKHLGQLDSVTPHPRERLGLHLRPALANGEGEILHSGGKGLSRVDRSQLLAAGPDPGEGQQIVYEDPHALGPVHRESNKATSLVVEGVAITALQKLHVVRDSAQGLFQVVGSNPGELLEVLVAALQFLGAPQEVLLRPLALRDVADRARHAGGIPVVVPQRQAPRPEPPVVAISATQAILDIVGNALIEMGFDGGLGLVQVIRVQP